MSSVTFKIKTSKKSNLKKFLRQIGYKFEERPNMIWLAQFEDSTLTLYRNNTLLIQGKEIDKIVEILAAGNFLAGPIMPKTKLLGSGSKKWIGTDEVGKGDYFGPLIVAGVMVTDMSVVDLWKLGVRDSKAISDHSVIALSKEINKYAHSAPDNLIWSLVTIKSKRYNELHDDMKNINRILAWGHARVIENILKVKDCRYAISDKFGDQKFIENALLSKGKKIAIEQRERAEDDVGVATASILARNEFIFRLNELTEIYKIDFPKGASEEVIKAGREFVQRYGKERLEEVAKVHFKTTKEILDTK